MPLDSRQRESLREEVIRFLAARHPVPFETTAIAHHIRRRQLVDFPCDDQEVDAAAAFLKDLQLAEEIPNELGASKAWKATAKGVVHAERHGLV
jgi:hypothetical protein